MRDIYTALYDEAVATRAEWLEAAIVLLIVLEIVMAFLALKRAAATLPDPPTTR